MSNPTKKRKFHIEPLDHRVAIDPNYADEAWKILEHGIHEIYNARAVSREDLLFPLFLPLLFFPPTITTNLVLFVVCWKNLSLCVISISFIMP